MTYLHVKMFVVVDATTKEILSRRYFCEPHAQETADRLIKKGQAAIVEGVW